MAGSASSRRAAFGTIEILPRGGKVMQTGRPVEVTIGAPIPVADRSLEELMAEVRDFLVENVENGVSTTS